MGTEPEQTKKPLMDYEKIEASWEQWRTRGFIPDDAEFFAMVEAYRAFRKLEEIFSPKSESFRTLMSLEDVERMRKRKDR